MTTAPPTGHRLPDDTTVGTVRLQVSDVERSIAYYESVVGLETKRRENGSVTMGPRDEPCDLVGLRERPGAAPVPARGRLGLYHFAILLPDRAALGRFLAHLLDHGVRHGAADHLVSEALYLTDPDGLGIEVYADRPRDTWRRRGSELVMATDPLAVASVLRAGGGEPWSGLPAGTVVGHVHLHVGDLAEASRFYHGALGMDVTVSSYPGALFLSAGGYHHHLGVNTWSHGGPANEDDARLLAWELVLPYVDDVTAAGRSLAESGFATTPIEGGEGVVDPWGTRLNLRAANDDGRAGGTS